ncbi:MAG: hypothetical protein ACRDRN_03155, partial [Sciscionella sp.]
APVALIASHPTRGVDVGAQALIWEQIRTARAKGLAVLLISADLDELIGLSDSIKVILRGRLVADADPVTVTPAELGAAMTGAGGEQQGIGASQEGAHRVENIDGAAHTQIIPAVADDAEESMRGGDDAR